MNGSFCSLQTVSETNTCEKNGLISSEWATTRHQQCKSVLDVLCSTMTHWDRISQSLSVYLAKVTDDFWTKSGSHITSCVSEDLCFHLGRGACSASLQVWALLCSASTDGWRGPSWWRREGAPWEMSGGTKPGRSWQTMRVEQVRKFCNSTHDSKTIFLQNRTGTNWVFLEVEEAVRATNTCCSQDFCVLSDCKHTRVLEYNESLWLRTQTETLRPLGVPFPAPHRRTGLKGEENLPSIGLYCPTELKNRYANSTSSAHGQWQQARWN